MRFRSALLAVVLVASCNTSGGGDVGPLELRSISPTLGSVAGGTLVTIDGSGFSSSTKISIGPNDCGSVSIVSPSKITCMTTSSHFVEGPMDVFASNGSTEVALSSAFTYQCPWTTTSGRRSCGAAPPSPVESPTVATWITQFQGADGFEAVPATANANMADTADHVLGNQSVSFSTDGLGTTQNLVRMDGAPIDATNKHLAVWIKLENAAHLKELYLFAGDTRLHNYYKFLLTSYQGQSWITEGDWVSFTLSFSPNNYTVVGSPNRAALTDFQIRAADDATGVPVKVHLNGIGLIDEPLQEFPSGVVSFTFDDNYKTMIDPGSTLLAAHGYAGTAYVIVDMVGKPNRATLDDLHALQMGGWDVSVHANTDAHHSAQYVTLSNAEVEDDMVDARAWLISNGFDGYDHCGYPNGEFSGGPADVLGLANRYFASCRTIFQRQHETFPPADARKLRVLYVTSAVTLADVSAAIDNAKANREWLILVFHRLVDTVPAALTEWPRADFAQLLDHVAASGITVKPVGEVLAPAQ